MRRGMTVLFPFSLDTGVHFVGGDPQSAEFCDGPGPGMALERNSFPADAPTGPGDAGGSKDRRSSLT